jgi:hypothetical protein
MDYITWEAFLNHIERESIYTLLWMISTLVLIVWNIGLSVNIYHLRKQDEKEEDAEG